MKTTFSRTDESIFGRWWWTVDRWMIAAIISILACGAILTLAASPEVAKDRNLDIFYYVYRHFIFVPLAFIFMIIVSFLNFKGVKQLATICFGFSLIFMILVLKVLWHDTCQY